MDWGQGGGGGPAAPPLTSGRCCNRTRESVSAGRWREEARGGTRRWEVGGGGGRRRECKAFSAHGGGGRSRWTAPVVFRPPGVGDVAWITREFCCQAPVARQTKKLSNRKQDKEDQADQVQQQERRQRRQRRQRRRRGRRRPGRPSSATPKKTGGTATYQSRSAQSSQQPTCGRAHLRLSEPPRPCVTRNSKVSTPAHRKDPGWYVDLVSREGTKTRCCGRCPPRGSRPRGLG